MRKRYIDENRKKVKLELPNEIRPYVTVEESEDNFGEYYGVFDTRKYFFEFLTEFYQVILNNSVPLPPGLTMSTSYTPCEVCRNEDNIVHKWVRCRHQPSCKQHHEKKRKEKDCTCDCQVFTSPCLSTSKVGICVHLEFKREGDSKPLRMDMDVTPAQLPVDKNRSKWSLYEGEQDYDGSGADKKRWLEKNRPVGWLTEWHKTPDMSEAAHEGDGLPRPVRLRNFNDQDVIPEEVK